ncbi:MAG: exosortase U [Prosthecobacter sp.]
MNNIAYEKEKRAGGVLAAATPLLCLLFSTYELWERHPACHFFPLPLAALGWLIFQTRPHAGTAPATPARNWLVCLYLALALAAFGLVSPFLAGLSFVVAMLAYSCSLGGEGRGMFPAWSFPALALFFIPPPLELDDELHQVLAGLAARLSQGWLDTMGVIHVVEGVIVATPEKRFFVDDACSGTNSLLVALCVAVVLASLKKRTLPHLAALLAVTGLVSVASNVLRICVVIGGLHLWKVELDSGMPHEMLGIAFFVLDLLLVLSADHGLHFTLNRPQPVREEPMMNMPRSSGMPPLWHKRVSVIAAAAGLMLLLGPAALSLTRSTSTAEPTASLDQFTMPQQLGGWVRAGEKPVEDTVIGKLGVRNQVWLYRNNGLEAYVAVNFPFLGFHDTRLCYQGQGWQFQRQIDSTLPGDAGNTLRFLHMHQPTELMHADLWLCVLDEKGTARTFSSENLVERMTNRLISRWQEGDAATTTYVLQVLAVEPGSQEGAQRSYIDLVTGARDGLAAAISNRNEPQGKESE